MVMKSALNTRTFKNKLNLPMFEVELRVQLQRVALGFGARPFDEEKDSFQLWLFMMLPGIKARFNQYV